MRYFILFLALATLCLQSCKKEDQRTIDEELIQSYIQENNLNTTVTTSGLHYIINSTGSGGSPSTAATVEVDYTGYFLNGFVFDSGQGAILSLNNVIAGWREGIPKLQKQGSAKLIVPSHLGYGRYGNNSIPGNTVLVFDVVLNDFAN